VKLSQTIPLPITAIVLVALTGQARADEPAPTATPASQVTHENTPKESAPPSEPEHLRLGAIGGVGFPRPLAIEGLVKIERTVALGLEYSLLPNLTISNVHTSFWAIAADARIFPFGGAFFVGLRAGHQHLQGETTVAAGGYSLDESLAIDTWFINPRIGLLWTWSPGFTFGMEAGAQIPLSATTASTLPSGVAVSSDLTSAANTFGKHVLPTVDLIRIGWLF
jgi:hypothetical protein